MNRVLSNFSSVHCPSTVGHSPKHSNFVVDGFFAPSTLRFQPSAFTSSENTICIRDEAFCTVDANSGPNTEFVSGVYFVPRICGFFCQRLPAKRDKILRRPFAPQSFEWRLPVATLLTSGQDAPCMFDQPRQYGLFITEWLLRVVLNVALYGSKDSTALHHCVLHGPVRFLVSLHCTLCGDFLLCTSRPHDSWTQLSQVLCRS